MENGPSCSVFTGPLSPFYTDTLEYSPILIENVSHSINIPEGILKEDLVGKVTGKNYYKASYNLEESTLIIDVRTELYYHNELNEQILLIHIEVRNGYLSIDS